MNDTTQQPAAATPPMNLNQVIDLRNRVLAGEEVSRDDLRRALEFLRQDRSTAAATSKKSGGSKTQPIDIASLFKSKE